MCWLAGPGPDRGTIDSSEPDRDYPRSTDRRWAPPRHGGGDRVAPILAYRRIRKPAAGSGFAATHSRMR